NNQTSEPDRDEIIKKGYNIMETAKWTPDQQALYLKQKMREQDLRLTQESLIEEARQEAFDKGKLEGEIRGKIKGEISKVKDFIKFGISFDRIKEQANLKFLTSSLNLEKSLVYINDHINDTESEICEELGLDSEAYLSSIVPGKIDLETDLSSMIP
ncbi:MAG: hypothetical protein SFT93_05970, partial [Rickettsiaceae bacterium]|nr:hypothetical protein [Rickettsiaceae bacterium]